MGDLTRALVSRSATLAQTLATGYAAGNRTYRVVIERITGEPGWDRSAGTWVDAPRSVVYRGPARVMPLTGGQDDPGTDAPEWTARARITIDGSTQLVRVQDVVTVVDDAVSRATNAAGRVLQITDVEVGGLLNTGVTFTAEGVDPSRWSR